MKTELNETLLISLLSTALKRCMAKQLQYGNPSIIGNIIVCCVFVSHPSHNLL